MEERGRVGYCIKALSCYLKDRNRPYSFGFIFEYIKLPTNLDIV